jgi:hypothetical protein
VVFAEVWSVLFRDDLLTDSRTYIHMGSRTEMSAVYDLYATVNSAVSATVHSTKIVQV